MLKARKGNRVVRIPDEKKEAYIALGYSITDMDGNMIHEHLEPSEKLTEAEKEIADLKEKISELEKENATLKELVAESDKAETKKTTKASSKAEK